MAIMENSNGNQDIVNLWTLLTEVSEQLSKNHSSSVSLHSLAAGLKAQAVHSQTGFVLRRFNLDKPKDIYEAELERMNTAMAADNQTLQNDNRQLNALIREYEQTLETVMSSFRTRAYEVQQHELALTREYESAIVQRETEALEAALFTNNARSESLARIGRLLRAIMRKLAGEDMKTYEEVADDAPSSSSKRMASSSVDALDPESSVPQDNTASEAHGGDEKDQYSMLAKELNEEEDSENLQTRLAAAEWALERECELARLERENEELRNLFKGVLNADMSAAAPAPVIARPVLDSDPSESGRASPTPSTSSTITMSRLPRQLGGLPGTVGPFGTFKKRAAN